MNVIPFLLGYRKSIKNTLYANVPKLVRKNIGLIIRNVLILCI